MIIADMQTTPSPTGALRLADWGVIRAQGADAASFLHGQLTQDTLGLTSTQARLAGYCSAKGRLLASFVLWRAAPDEIWLACSADLLAATLKRLSMFVLRAKCKLSDISNEVSVFGWAGEAASVAFGEAGAQAMPSTPWAMRSAAGGALIRLPDGAHIARYLHVLPNSTPAPAAPALEAATWQWLEVASGVVRITAATAEQFVPQMVNLEAVGGVNFQKGCYPGQEIVARSQYRGTLKRRAMRFDCDAELSIGQEIFHSNDAGQPAGLVANAAPRPGGGSSVLAEVKLAALDSGSLRAASASGALLRPVGLPYVLPTEAA